MGVGGWTRHTSAFMHHIKRGMGLGEGGGGGFVLHHMNYVPRFLGGGLSVHISIVVLLLGALLPQVTCKRHGRVSRIPLYLCVIMYSRIPYKA